MSTLSLTHTHTPQGNHINDQHQLLPTRTNGDNGALSKAGSGPPLCVYEETRGSWDLPRAREGNH